MSARSEIADRVERSLAAHEITTRAVDPKTGGVVVRCKCQPRDGPMATHDQWRRHVAERATDAALRIYS